MPIGGHPMEDMKIENNSVEFRSVIFSDGGITEKAGMLSPLHFNRDEIKLIEVKKGFVAERPMVAIIAGLILLTGCALIYLDIIGKFVFGGTIYVETFLPIIFIPLAVWLIIYGLKRNYLLLIHTNAGKRKIAFKGHVEPKELFGFIQRAKSVFGYDIMADEALSNKHHG
jgi:hypothetical protein